MFDGRVRAAYISATMERYDYLLAGGGAAGLSLAYHMLHSGLRDCRIAIIDKDPKRSNDRTWCFWTDRRFVFDSVIRKRWNRMEFVGTTYRDSYDLAPYQYRMIPGIELYTAMHDIIERSPNVEFVHGVVEEIHDTTDGAEVKLENGTRLKGAYLFDSLLIPERFQVDTKRYHFIKQHFKGWFIETDLDCFEPDSIRFFDFRVPQYGVMRFVYILPFSARSALVEYTLFSAELLSRDEYERELRDYIENVLGIHTYRIVEEEQGVIPMTDQTFRRRGGRHILYTGTKGGRVKASSGFAFHRIQHDSAAIVASLERYSHPFALPRAPRRYRLLDAMLLQILYRRGQLSEEVFTRLFKHNPVHRVLRFLNEETSLAEDLRLMATVPWWPFIRAFFRLKTLGP